jgi:hypothetical protein
VGSRGDNKQSYARYEELKHPRVSPEAGTPYIYKRLDTQVHLPVEERAWQIRVPVPSTKGVRKSLKVTEKADAISKAEEMVLELRVQLKQGVGVLPTPVERLGLARFSGQVNRRHAMTLRLSIDDQSNQDQAPVHGAAEAGGC